LKKLELNQGKPKNEISILNLFICMTWSWPGLFTSRGCCRCEA